MIVPSFEEFKKLARKGNLIALRSDMTSDLETPVSAFLKLASQESCAFLLESAEQEERIGRYSFLGVGPESMLTSRGGDAFLKERGLVKNLGSGRDLLTLMKKRLQAVRLANAGELPNFAGGFVGFLGYENVRLFERIELGKKNGLAIEDGVFFMVKEFVMFDHFRKRLSVVSICEIEGGDKSLKKAYKCGVTRIEKLEARLRGSLPRLSSEKIGKRRVSFESAVSRKEFESEVRRVKEYIKAGDCIQVVLSQRFRLGRVSQDFEIYRALHSINPSPYMFYFRCGSLRLIGSSPEVLVKKTGGIAEVRPIAGTRPRGRDAREDGRFEESLSRSVKEQAEHLMLVDLGRNDLGRVCDFRTVKVNEFARVERYSHVMHLVSSVTGRLRREKDAFDLLRATFPAGTVTGAPKIRAMEIIDELERERRGPYAGALGYFSFNRDMDMCITIRTVVIVGSEAYVQAGAGIVYDSQPRKEYEETINKARALVQAVHRERGRAKWFL